mmetsp:Transcript_58318/g.94353  ORF Transcript_58318/g.94353 Transcript_58318/m.94353 type:complete len:82 (-) Transcript_58318:3-248(-)
MARIAPAPMVVCGLGGICRNLVDPVSSSATRILAVSAPYSDPTTVRERPAIELPAIHHRPSARTRPGSGPCYALVALQQLL